MKVFLGFLFACFAFFGILISFIFFLGSSSRPAPYEEMTQNYEMPPGMEGCRVYVLGGGYTNTYPLWVVVRPDGSFSVAR